MTISRVMDALLALDEKVVDSVAARVEKVLKTRDEGLPALTLFHFLTEDVEVGHRQKNGEDGCIQVQGTDGRGIKNIAVCPEIAWVMTGAG